MVESDKWSRSTALSVSVAFHALALYFLYSVIQPSASYRSETVSLQVFSQTAVSSTAPARKAVRVLALAEKGPAPEPQAVANGADENPQAVLDEKAAYLAELKRLIESLKSYPAASKRLNESGRVVVAFEITGSGDLLEPRLKSKSEFERLNRAALAMITAMGRFKPLPAVLRADRLTVEVPVDYVLE